MGSEASPGKTSAPAAANSGTTDGPDCPRALSLDVAAIEAEVACLLSRYVRIDTTNPPGNELAGARFLAAVLEGEGIPATIVESAPGRASLHARLPGRVAGSALVLMHHEDVVPANPGEWSVPPFSGEVRDGEVRGRGSIDNKGGGVVGLVTILLAKRLGIALPHDLDLLAVADEETGGGLGTRWLLRNRPDLFAGVGCVLAEGGHISTDAAGSVAYEVEVAQKAPLWLRLTAHGPAGHGSSPRPDAATHVLARALGRLADHRFPVEVLPDVAAFYRVRAGIGPATLRAGERDLAASLRDPAFREAFLARPRDAALVRDTLAITMLSGSAAVNVLPATATASLDLRLLPGHDPAAVTAELVAAMAEPAIEVETLLSWRAHVSPPDPATFSAIEALAAAKDPGAVVVPAVIAGFTDCNAFRAAGIPCYGFTPVRLDRADLVRVHGVDERVRAAVLARAVVDMVAIAASR